MAAIKILDVDVLGGPVGLNTTEFTVIDTVIGVVVDVDHLGHRPCDSVGASV